jgi:hypothetical protein
VTNGRPLIFYIGGFSYEGVKFEGYINFSTFMDSVSALFKSTFIASIPQERGPG